MIDETTKDNHPDLIEAVYEFKLSPGQTPERLDVYLTNSIRNATRTKIRRAIDEGCVLINGKKAKASRKIKPNDNIICKILKSPPIELVPEEIPLDIIWEDDVILIVNKPPNMVTHPGFGNRYGTLVNAVLFHLGKRDSIKIEIDDEEDDIAESKIYASDDIRPGIVHRLDKDTSGVMMIVKNSIYHPMMQRQFAERTIERFYYALVWGNVKEDSGTIEGDIGRSLRNRKLFAVVKKDGKHAVTDYEVIERFGLLTLVKIKLRTGRTHQIRVHFSHNNHPVFGDYDYGGDRMNYGGFISEKKQLLQKCLSIVNRQMLHAKILGFDHPVTNERHSYESELPEDFKSVIKILKENIEKLT